VVIGGCGTVGSLMARVLKHHGADVTISDSANDTPLRDVFISEGIHLDLGGHSDAVIMEAETIVVAPSLMENHTLLENIRSLSDAPIISVDEILSFFKVEKPVVGITGTNGKTTTTHMLKNILKVAGMSVPEHFMNMQGNTELIPALQSRLKGDAAVVEIGTFGRAGEIKNSALNCEVSLGVITNISRDHLRGDDFNEYISCKREMVDAADIIILNADDPLVADFAEEIHPDNVIFYGIKDMESDENTFPEGRECPECENILKYDEHYLGHLGDYRCMCDYKRPEIDVYATSVTENSFKLNIGSNTYKIHLKTGGTCNVYNALAAASAAMVMGVDFDDIVSGIAQFEGVNGRFEKICNNPEIKTSLESRLIVINTISSESGRDGDREIAQILNSADIIIPASFMAKESSNIIKRDLIFTESSNEQTKIGTLGANKKQVYEAINKALKVVNDNDIILIIGEGGVKYSKEILEEISI
jgi:UDP-N-acetylmuramoylalanine-D-glutamate ligase